MVQILEILNSFLSFSMVYNHSKAHNMLAIMFDLSYKNMKCIWDLVGKFVVVEIVVEYDTKIVCPLLLHVNNHLNPIKDATKTVTTKKDFVFGQIVLANDVILSILKNDLHYFVTYLYDQYIMITP